MKVRINEETKRWVADKIIYIINTAYTTWETQCENYRLANPQMSERALSDYCWKNEPTISALILRDELRDNYVGPDDFAFWDKQTQYAAVYNELQKLLRAGKIQQSTGVLDGKEVWLYEPAE